MSRRLLIALVVGALAAAATFAVLRHDRSHGTGVGSTKLHNGMTKAEVRTAWGKPDQISFIPYPSAGQVDQGFEECWDYGIATLPKTPYYQLCFWSGKLTSQARYGE